MSNYQQPFLDRSFFRELAESCRKSGISVASCVLQRRIVTFLMMGLCLVSQFIFAHAVGVPGPKQWSASPAISGTISANMTTVEVGKSVNVTVTGAADTDSWSRYYTISHGLVDSGTASDSISYTWTQPMGVAGSFSGTTSSSTTWTAPNIAGIYIVACTVDDAPASVSSPETGSRDDAANPLGMFIFVVNKGWSTDTSIGQVKDSAGNITYNGRITSPQDQRVSPASPAKVVVAPGENVSLAIETATDRDMWAINLNGDGDYDDPGEKGYDDDTIASYTWAAPSGTNAPASPTSQSTTWKAPYTPGTYTLTCTVKDAPKSITSPDTGSRDDGDLVRSVVVQVWKASLKVRRTSADTYAGSTTVAAGNVANGAHQADVEATITDANDVPLAGITPNNAVVVTNGKGVAGSGTVASITAFGATDSNGKTQATFRSGLRVGESVGIKLPYDSANPSTSAGPTASVSQVWPDGTWDYAESFEFDLPSAVSYTIKLSDDTGISGHGAHFETTEISGYEWDDEAGDDWDDDGEPDGDYTLKVYTKLGNSTGWNTWNSLSSFGAVTESGGTYSADQTVTFDQDFIVDRTDFTFIDENVYDLDGEDF